MAPAFYSEEKAKYLAPNRCSRNICWINEVLNQIHSNTFFPSFILLLLLPLSWTISSFRWSYSLLPLWLVVWLHSSACLSQRPWPSSSSPHSAWWPQLHQWLKWHLCVDSSQLRGDTARSLLLEKLGPTEYELCDSRDWIFLVNCFIARVKYVSWDIVVIQETLIEWMNLKCFL